MLLWQIHATVASLLMPDYPHTNEHLCDHVFITILLTSALLSPRPGWNLRWCYHRQVPKPLCENHRNLGTSSHGAIRHKLTSYRRIHKSAIWGVKTSKWPRFALSRTHAPSILHCWECYIALVQGVLPVSCYDATVRAAFIPDSTLDLFSIFSSSRYTKSSIFSCFLHS